MPPNGERRAGPASHWLSCSDERDIHADASRTPSLPVPSWSQCATCLDESLDELVRGRNVRGLLRADARIPCDSSERVAICSEIFSPFFSFVSGPSRPDTQPDTFGGIIGTVPSASLPVKRHRWSRDTHGTHGRLPVPNKCRRGTGEPVSKCRNGYAMSHVRFSTRSRCVRLQRSVYWTVTHAADVANRSEVRSGGP